MADLTVLHSPKPLYPLAHGLFSKSTPRLVYQPTGPPTASIVIDDSSEISHDPTTPKKPVRRPHSQYDSSFLSPPINTWKSPQRQHRHRPSRSQSAPPGPDRRPKLETVPDEPAINDHIPSQTGYPPSPRSKSKRSFSAFSNPLGTTRGGELLPPPPPLLRPTTFWRKTRRSGVTGASYSPSSHLIRRSTYIAAGLQFDAPMHDLTALCVESRIGCIVIPPDFENLPTRS